MIRVGVIGYGYWGPGIVRNFHGVEGCEVAMVCDKSTSALKRLSTLHDGPSMPSISAVEIKNATAASTSE